MLISIEISDQVAEDLRLGRYSMDEIFGIFDQVKKEVIRKMEEDDASDQS